MSKSQHGNREAKKPKKVRVPENPLAPAVAVPGLPVARSDIGRKK